MESHELTPQTIDRDPRDSFPVDNGFLNSRFSCGVRQMRIIFHVLARMQTNDDAMKTLYRIDITELGDNLSAGNYRQIKRNAEDLQTVAFHLPKPDGGFSRYVLFPTIHYNPPADGDVAHLLIGVNSHLRNLLFDLKARFSRLELASLLSFKSSYSIRLFLLLRSHAWLGEREIPIDFLRDRLELGDKLQRIDNLKARAIRPAIKEINAMSTLRVTMSTVTDGGKVTAFHFRIEDRSDRQKISEKIRAALPNPRKRTDNPPPPASPPPDAAQATKEAREDIQALEEERQRIRSVLASLEDETRNFLLERADRRLRAAGVQFIARPQLEALAVEILNEENL